jgi:hypothetical protein
VMAALAPIADRAPPLQPQAEISSSSSSGAAANRARKAVFSA